MNEGIKLTPEHGYSYEYLKEFLAIDYRELQFFGAILVLVGVVLLGCSLTGKKDTRRFACLVLGVGAFFYYFGEVMLKLCGM